MIDIKKEHRVSFRITEEELLMLNKISLAVLEPSNLSETFRIMIQNQFVDLKNRNLIKEGCYE